MIRSPRRPLLYLALAIPLGGCGDSPPGIGEIPPSSVAVNVGNVFFQSVHNGSIHPALDTVGAGGAATWTWIEPGTHGVRFEAAGLPESPQMTESGSVFRMTFPTAGTYTYHCPIHGSVMSGTIVVK